MVGPKRQEETVVKVETTKGLILPQVGTVFHLAPKLRPNRSLRLTLPKFWWLGCTERSCHTPEINSIHYKFVTVPPTHLKMSNTLHPPNPKSITAHACWPKSRIIDIKAAKPPF